jgi:hypothetical protein
MPDPQKPKFPKVATFALLILALGFAAVNAWPRPRGIYGTDYGWPLTLATAGSAAYFDVLAFIVDLVVALDVLVLVGAMLSPSIRKLAPFWIPFVLLQLIIAGLIKLMFQFVIR